MTSHSPALGEALLALPEPWIKARPGSAHTPPDAFRKRLTRAHSRAREQARAGEDIFRVVVALQDSVVEDLLPSAVSSFTQALHSSPVVDSRGARGSAASLVLGGLAAGSDEAVVPSIDGAGQVVDAGSDAECVSTLRAHAAALVAAGDIGGAINILCALMDWPAARDDALLGLAICAVRIDRHDEALALALAYLKLGGKHPRAHCIVGVCQLRNGERRAAQNHLAIAVRAARGDATFRDELRAAQRLLIVLNFGA